MARTSDSVHKGVLTSARSAYRVATLTAVFLSAAPASAQSTASHIPLAGPVPPPSAAADLCDRYAWACSGARAAVSDPGRIVAAAREVNRRVNSRVRAVDDSVQYRVKDLWTLPTKRGGDCEDFALLKKHELIARGVPANRLLIATVYARNTGAHAVLVLRLDDGDVVLDSMTDQIKPWQRTGYTFLRVQNPRAPESWVSVSTKG